ncbi:MAG: hypothetical protein PHW77_03330 [Eubacteriales bacterium]|nr:hypothetical protein [Eubacteriales bacterium]
MQVIIIHGSPGTGKTTTASKLHEYYKSPWFEFGWIPEFRNLNPHTEISYRDEEEMTFESLMLVVKNYNRHGFENVIISDLNDIRIFDIYGELKEKDFIIITLYSNDDGVIKERILNRDNGNSYKDWESAVKLNNAIKNRVKLPNEYRIRSDNIPVDEVIGKILDVINNYVRVDYDMDKYNREDYFSYTD